MKHNILVLVFLLIALHSFTQTLNLPARQTNALSGSQFISLVTNYTLTNRENQIWAEVTSGNIPNFQRNLIPITFTETINSTSYTIKYYTIPDYLAIGNDTDYFLCPMTPLLAQRIADFVGCILPTRKMVNQIWNAATVKLAPSSIPPSSQMTTIPIMSQHNTTVWGQRSAVINAHPLGELVGGDKKDVIISNSIYGNPAPGRVVIYGWHQLNGIPIQPLYAGHEETYADYSHGIRLVQKSITINEATNTISGILQSSTLNSLLSDEGAISIPHYPGTTDSLSTPTVFAITSENSYSLRIVTQVNANIQQYKVQLSDDGITFNAPQYHPSSNTVVTGLLNNHLYFIRIAAIGNSDTTTYSEMLGAVTSACPPKAIIVNGFDRSISGNTYDFIKQHGTAFYHHLTNFSSATNEAIISGLVNLTDYKIADYILGNESTANETFNNTEQTLVKTFLESGGNLFISGGEIAWDLDHSGTTTDKDFYNNYLKATYVNDAPNGQSNTFYQCTPVVGEIFNNISNFSFDDGTHGAYNVSYPDVINGINGGINCLGYVGGTAQNAGISFNGMFPNGSQTGKIVNLGFPFETVYPDSSRFQLMNKILDFFDVQTNVVPPYINTPEIYCQFDTANSLAAIGENLIWYIDSTATLGTSIAPVPSTQNSGTFQYFVSQTIGGCESSRAKITITINPKPAAPQLTAFNDTIYANVTSNVQWYANGTLIIGVSTPFIPISFSGWCIATTTINGCTSDYSIPFIIETSVEKLFSDIFTTCIIYPNPVTNISSLKLIETTDEILETFFFDLSGKQIFSQKPIYSMQTAIDKRNFGQGLYFYKIITKKGTVLCGKFLVTD